MAASDDGNNANSIHDNDDRQGEHVDITIDDEGFNTEARGYTPLTEVDPGMGRVWQMLTATTTNGGMPHEEEEEEEEYRNGNGALFSTGPSDSDEEDEDKEGDNARDDRIHNNNNNNNTACDDYRAVADQALAALEAEYWAVLQQGQRCATRNAASHVTTATSSAHNMTDRNTATITATEVASQFRDADCPIEIMEVERSQTNERTDHLFSMAASLETETVVDEEQSHHQQHQKQQQQRHEEYIAGTSPQPLPTNTTTTKPIPTIDTDAVRRAVQSIQLRHPQLNTALAAWERSNHLPPRTHPIIPTVPLKAFWKNTTKARQATTNLTRAATLAEAIVRLQQFAIPKEQPPEELMQSNDGCFRIHIIGCDTVECQSAEQIRTFFAPFVRWWAAAGFLSSSSSSITTTTATGATAIPSTISTTQCNTIFSPPTYHALDLLLLGPSVPMEMVAHGPVNLLPASSNTSTVGLTRATATCYAGCYDQWLSNESTTSTTGTDLPPDIVIAFNAGIWGYREWVPTLHAMHRYPHPVSFVVTAYTLAECEDDEEVFHTVLSDISTEMSNHNYKELSTMPIPTIVPLWEAQRNPFASRLLRPTIHAQSGQEYRENYAWQAWRL